MKKLILVLIWMYSHPLFAQSKFELLLGGNMDDNGASMASTSTGDYLICGSSFSYSSDRRGIIIKTDSVGSIRWSKIFFKGTFFKLSQALELLDGNYMFSGTVLDSIHPEGDMLLMKTDTSGTILWSKLYGTTGPDYIPTLHAIVQLPDSGFAFVGGSDLNFSGLEDISILRTDKNGDTLWTKFYHASYRDQASSIAATPDGGFIISGRTNSFGIFIMDMFLMKLDSLGSLEWTRQYGGPAWEEATGAIPTADGGYAVCGSARSFSINGDYDGLVFKTDNSGALEWVTTVGDSSSDALYDIIATPDGGFVCLGITESFFNHQLRSSAALDSDTTDLFLCKLDASGDTLWSKVIGGNKIEEAYSVKQHADKGFMIAALTHSYSGNNSLDILAIKTDSTGSTCSSSPVAPVVMHPTLSTDTITFLSFTPISYRSFLPDFLDVAINDSILCQQFTSFPALEKMHMFQAYPNPFWHSFKIAADNITDFKKCSFKMVDLYGRDVTNEFTITSLSQWAEFTAGPGIKSGCYMLVISEPSKADRVIKLVSY